jgi:seryl-tRNA synthetase
MAQVPNDKNKLAQEKRDLARRCRRLAQTQVCDADIQRLMRYADELDAEAAALESATPTVLLSLPDMPSQHVQHQQVQQQQSAEASTKGSLNPFDDKIGGR